MFDNDEFCARSGRSLRFHELMIHGNACSIKVAALSLFSQNISVPRMKGTFMAMSLCSNSRDPVDLACHFYLQIAWYRVSNKYSAPATAAPVPMQRRDQGFTISENPGQKLFFCLRYSWNSRYLLGSSFE